MTPEPTFVFDNEKAYALVNGRVIAAASNLEELEEKVADLSKVKIEDATHIVTPNGLKGQILGKVQGLYGDEVTIRLENGNITRVAVSDHLEFTQEREEKASPIEDLKQRLEAVEGDDRESLQERRRNLQGIRSDVQSLMTQGLSYDDETALQDLDIQAEYEDREIGEVLDHLDAEETEAFAPPAPFEMNVMEQADLGGNDGTWLDNTMNEMIEEAQSTDFGQLMDEGPELFVSEMEEAPLADAGITQQMASSFIQGKTAGVREEVRQDYQRVFLARVEEVRKEELKRRQVIGKEEATQKESSYDDYPDDILFT